MSDELEAMSHFNKDAYIEELEQQLAEERAYYGRKINEFKEELEGYRNLIFKPVSYALDKAEIEFISREDELRDGIRLKFPYITYFLPREDARMLSYMSLEDLVEYVCNSAFVGEIAKSLSEQLHDALGKKDD